LARQEPPALLNVAEGLEDRPAAVVLDLDHEFNPAPAILGQRHTFDPELHAGDIAGKQEMDQGHPDGRKAPLVRLPQRTAGGADRDKPGRASCLVHGIGGWNALRFNSMLYAADGRTISWSAPSQEFAI
jgi:hypothetical protein